MNISNKDFIAINLPKLSDANILNILLNFKVVLDKYNARIEKQNIGTYIYLGKLPEKVLADMRKDIEYYM